MGELTGTEGIPCSAAEPDQATAQLPRHWARDFFLVHLCLEAQSNEEALGRLQARACKFCLCPFKLSMR